MIKLEEHFGEKVWTNTRTDSIRREECLCLKCDKMTYNKNTNCSIAQAFYEQCVEHNVAFTMTRCKSFQEK